MQVMPLPSQYHVPARPSLLRFAGPPTQRSRHRIGN